MQKGCSLPVVPERDVQNFGRDQIEVRMPAWGSINTEAPTPFLPERDLTAGYSHAESEQAAMKTRKYLSHALLQISLVSPRAPVIVLYEFPVGLVKPLALFYESIPL